MKLANNILLKALGILLLTAAILKGWQLMNEPVANNNIWSNRWFLIMTVEFELALGIWLVSGLFKKAAWLASIGCFSFFSMVTLYKGITGFASCGCFGSVHVNPWITLFAVDLPAVIALLIFRPQFSQRITLLISRILSLPLVFLSFPHIRHKLQRGSIQPLISEFLHPLPSFRYFTAAFIIGILVLGITTPILALNEPAVVTSKYEVLEPSTWVGKELPILEHIDIADTLKKGTWLVLLYHYDCPDCGTAIPMYERMARDLEGNEEFMQIALVEVPPYGRYLEHKGPVSENSPCTLGRLAEAKDWFVTTPAVALLKNGQVTSAWEEKAPDLDTFLQKIATTTKSNVATSLDDKTKSITRPEYLSRQIRPVEIEDKYCGLYVLWHALKFFDLNKSLEEIAERLEIGKKQGVSINELVESLKYYGFRVRPVVLDKHKLRYIRDPFIPFVPPQHGSDFGHFFFCVPTDDQQIVILDGPSEPVVRETSYIEGLDVKQWDGTSILIYGCYPTSLFSSIFTKKSAIIFLVTVIIGLTIIYLMGPNRKMLKGGDEK